MFRKTTKRQKVEELVDESPQQTTVVRRPSKTVRATKNEWSTLTSPWQQAHSAEDISKLRSQLARTEVSLDPEEVSRYSSVLQDGDDFAVKREVESLAKLRPQESADGGVPMAGVAEQREDFANASSDEEAVREWSESQMRSGAVWRLPVQLPAISRQHVTLSDFLSDIVRLAESTTSEIASTQAHMQQLEALEAKTTQKIEALTQTSLSQTETFVMFEEFKDFVETLLDCMEEVKPQLELAVRRIEGQERIEAATKRHFRLQEWCTQCQETLPMWQSTPPTGGGRVVRYEDAVEELFADVMEKYYDWKYILMSFNAIRTALPHLAAELNCESLLFDCVAGLAKLETWTWSPFREGWDLQTMRWYTLLSAWPKVREKLQREVLAPRVDFSLSQHTDLYDLVSVLRATEGGEFLRSRKTALLREVKSQLEDLSAPSTPEGSAFIVTAASTFLASLVALADFLPAGTAEALASQLLAGVYLSCLRDLKDEDVQRNYQLLLDTIEPLPTHAAAVRPIVAWARFERPQLLIS